MRSRVKLGCEEEQFFLKKKMVALCSETPLSKVRNAESTKVQCLLQLATHLTFSASKSTPPLSGCCIVRKRGLWYQQLG